MKPILPDVSCTSAFVNMAWVRSPTACQFPRHFLLSAPSSFSPTTCVHPRDHFVHYAPGESETGLFGGNSNWRGPVWFPVNYLLIESLERYHHFYGDSLKVECPAGSGHWINLREAAREIASRMATLFLPDAHGRRPCHGDQARFANDPHWRDLVLFHEYFHGDTGRGVGASHQTGWTALAVRCIEKRAADRGERQRSADSAATPVAAAGNRPAAPAAAAPQHADPQVGRASKSGPKSPAPRRKSG